MMKLTKLVFAVIVMCTLFISCTEEIVNEDDELFLKENMFATDETETPPEDDDDGTGG